MKAALVLMAAGLGSRYGGNKQVDGVGPCGEILMEYGIYDAIRAGLKELNCDFGDVNIEILEKGSPGLFGMFGRRAAETAHWCMGEGCVHLIASDAHSPFRRTTRLRDAWEYAADLDSPAIADFLLRDNPARILADRPIRPVLAEF